MKDSVVAAYAIGEIRLLTSHRDYTGAYSNAGERKACYILHFVYGVQVKPWSNPKHIVPGYLSFAFF